MQLEDLAALEDQFNRDLTFQLDMVSRDPVALEQLNQFLFAYVPSLRFHLLIDADEIQRIWNHVRDREVVTDVLLDLTSSLVFTTNLTKSDWSALIDRLATAWGCLIPSSAQQSSMVYVHEEQERFASKASLITLFTGNPWLVTLYFLRRSDYVSKHIAEAALRAAQAYQAEKNRGATQ